MVRCLIEDARESSRSCRLAWLMVVTPRVLTCGRVRPGLATSGQSEELGLHPRDVPLERHRVQLLVQACERLLGLRGDERGGQSSPTIRVLVSDPVDLEQVERQLRERLDALGPAPRAELLHVLMLPDFERVLPSRRPPRGERVTDRPNAANCAWFSADDLGR